MTIQEFQQALFKLGDLNAQVFLSADREGNLFSEVTEIGLADKDIILYPGRFLKPEEILSKGLYHKARV